MGVNSMIVAWIAWFGIYLLIQGLYVLRTGVVAPFFLAKVPPHLLPLQRRIMYGSVHLIGAAWLLSLVGMALSHSSVGIGSGDIAFASVMAAGGLWFSIRPTTALKWAQSAHPDLQLDNPFLLGVARIIGAVLLFIGLVFLLNR